MANHNLEFIISLRPYITSR